MNTATRPIKVGDFVVRNQGRPADIGQRGTVTALSSEWAIGSAGDVLATVTTPYGETFHCYTRQLDFA